MESVSLEGSAISITSFIFTFVQRVFYAYYEWFVDQLDLLIKNWFDFSLKKPTKFSLHVDPLTKQYLEVTPQSKYVTVLVDPESAQETTVFLPKSATNASESDIASQDAKSEKPQNEMLLRIKELIQLKEEVDKDEKKDLVDEETSIENLKKTSEYKEVKRLNKKGKDSLGYIRGTSLKLSEYHKKNEDYLVSKYEKGSNIDNYSFTHPDAHSIFSRSFVLQRPLSKINKKKVKVFRPTDLSTIFENLAY